MSRVALTCKAAFEALAEHQVCALEDRVRELELALYHEQLPPLDAVMARFNAEHTRCTCLCCQHAGRWSWQGIAGVPSGYEACRFATAWAAYLDARSVAVDAKAPAQDGHAAKFAQDCEAAVRATDFGLPPAPAWVSGCSWGRRLSSMHSPRRAMWDTIADIHQPAARAIVPLPAPATLH